MTSKKFFSSICKEDRKHQLGMTILSGVIFFFMTLFFVISLQNGFEGLGEKANQKEIVKMAVDCIAPMYFRVVPVIGLAIAMAANHFVFLHSKQKSDFYFSLPVSRQYIFFMKMKNSFFVFLVPMVIYYAVVSVITIASGAFSKTFLFAVCESAIYSIAVFLAMYATMVLAMILTGQTVVAMLGCIVFFAHAPLTLYIIPDLYARMFFKTYITMWNDHKTMLYFSPATLSFMIPNTEGLEKYVQCGALFLMAAILLIICYFLFMKRSAESAGKSMTFTKWNTAFKIWMLIPLSLFSGFLLYALTLEGIKLWILIGAIIGLIFFHGLIEAIYQLNVKAVWSHKKQMAACAVVICAIVGIFWFDLPKYDQYVPKAENVASVYVDHNLTDADDSLKGISGEDKMKILEMVKEIAKSNGKLNGDTSKNYGIEVAYRMKNGRKIYRGYAMEKETWQKLMTLLYNNKEYKEDFVRKNIPVSQNSKITSMSWDQGITSESLNVSKKQQEALFEAYKKDIQLLSYDMAATKQARGIVRLEITYADGRNTRYDSKELLIYDEYENTLALLKQYGMKTEQIQNRYVLQSVTLSKYDNKDGETKIVANKELQQFKNEIFIYSLYDGKVSTDRLSETYDLEGKVLYGGQETDITLTASDETIQKLLAISKSK